MKNEKGAYDGRPILVVEVVSPSTKSKDIMVKSQLYMASGIEEYWVIDTEANCIIIYHFRDRKLWEQQIVTRGQKARSMFFEGLEVDTADIYLD